MKNLFLILALAVITFSATADDFKTIQIPTTDGIQVTADEYIVHKSAPYLLLCHQAGWSRGEYRETALWFNELGFNCVAIDQRSGKSVNEVENKTASAAKAKDLPCKYIDAEPDILAAIRYIQNEKKTKPIMVESSYSAGLAIKIAAEQPDLLKAIVCYSPGEYYGKAVKLEDIAHQITVPVYFTCSKLEVITRKDLFNSIGSAQKTFYKPEGAGHHGSRALWSSKAGHEYYRTSTQKFLEQFK